MSYENASSLLLHIPWEDIVFPKVLSKLKVREVFNLYEASTKFHDLVTFYFAQLTKLSEYDLRGISTRNIMFLATTTSSIQILDFEAANLSDEVVELFLANNKQLVEVNLVATTLKPQTIYHLIHCNMLKSLNLQGCPWVTNECLQAIQHHCKGVKVNHSFQLSIDYYIKKSYRPQAFNS